MRIGGIVLCGGRSTRMGTAKAWLPIGNETMLGRTVRVIREVVFPVVVVAAVDQEVPPLPHDIAILRDEVSLCGPLSGLATGMAALAGQVDAIYLSACDLPKLDRETVHQLLQAFSPAAPVAVAQSERGLHPLTAVYALSLLPRIRERLNEGKLRMLDLIESIPYQAVAIADARSLVNLNTMREYREYLSSTEPDQAGVTDQSA